MVARIQVDGPAPQIHSAGSKTTTKIRRPTTTRSTNRNYINPDTAVPRTGWALVHTRYNSSRGPEVEISSALCKSAVDVGISVHSACSNLYSATILVLGRGSQRVSLLSWSARRASSYSPTPQSSLDTIPRAMIRCLELCNYVVFD